MKEYLEKLIAQLDEQMHKAIESGGMQGAEGVPDRKQILNWHSEIRQHRKRLEKYTQA